jgi:hypothetical protein
MLIQASYNSAIGSILFVLTAFAIMYAGILMTGGDVTRGGSGAAPGTRSPMEGQTRVGNTFAKFFNTDYGYSIVNRIDTHLIQMTPATIFRAVWHVAIAFVKLGWITTALIGLTSRFPARFRITKKDGRVVLAGWNTQLNSTAFAIAVVVLALYFWLMIAGTSLVRVSVGYSRNCAAFRCMVVPLRPP